jgi:hypothetical protein
MKDKRTAVDIAFQLLAKQGLLVTKDYKNLVAYQECKKLEREQIVDAWNGGDYAYFYSKETGRDFEDGDDYYEQRFGGQVELVGKYI